MDTMTSKELVRRWKLNGLHTVYDWVARGLLKPLPKKHKSEPHRFDRAEIERLDVDDLWAQIPSKGKAGHRNYVRSRR